MGTLAPYKSNLDTYKLESNKSYQILDKKYFVTNAIKDWSSNANKRNELNYSESNSYNEYITDSKYSRIKGNLITEITAPGEKTSTKLFVVGITAQGEMTLLGQYEHKAGTAAVPVDCDITGVNILRLYVFSDSSGWFYDAVLEGVQ